ncbi:protein FAM221B isoform X2 [Pteropus medius]|uniref:protein FAM221B isoform X2 n=1 Tax=Pteropus vampyrus TaxID=132908 RepID=UPI00196A9168|nr:protein FAM221B isoform X2 [Pteropus giganteus]
MEADKVIEEPQTTMDAEEHPSSKDPSAEDSQEPLITETPLEPSISETPLEPLTPETLLEPSTSQTPLETHTSETSLKPSIPQTSLEPHAYETLLEPSTSKASTPESPLESHISKVPEKHLSFHNSSPGHSSMSSSDTLKEDFFSESSSRKPSWRRSAQTSESEILEQHSLSGPSAQVHLDTSAKEREEDEEKEEVDTSIGTTHTAQPGRHPGKKKKGISRYKAHPVVPAKQAELVEVAKAMHREKFGAQVNNLFQWEKNAALNAIQTGLYIGWRCPHYLWDCFRIGDESKCFCGHLLREHQIISDISVPCNVGQCRCLMFCFIPSRPEEVGSKAVAAIALSLISSVRPVTGAGRNTRLSLRLRRPGDEEEGLTEQTMCLLQRCLPFEKPSSATLTSRPYRSRGPLANAAPTLVPLGSLAQAASNLALHLTLVPDSFTSILLSSRNRQCQHLAQASMSLAQISNKGEATGI